MNIKSIISILTICSAAIITSCTHDTNVEYNTAKVTRQNISTSITATGTIEPVTKVEVGTQVSGIIDKIYVDYNSIVHKGQVIAELDKTNLLSELASTQSNLLSAKNNYESTVATLNYQKANYNRYATLYQKGLVSANDYENARLSYETARMSAEQAKQQISVQEQNVTKAKTNLGYATITAPIDGIVLSKEVEEGQTVASAMSTPTLFIIAQDLTAMRVIANIDEADIGGVEEGQRVTFTVDAFPDDVFEGSVTQVRQEAKTESNVVTYEVVIAAPNADLKLKPGLTANVTIFTNEKESVLAVPTKALRFAPNETLLKEGESIEDCESKSKLWIKKDNIFKAIPVSTGMSNGSLTEVSGIAEGTEIITDFEMDMPEEEGPRGGSPFMPKPRGGNKKGGK